MTYKKINYFNPILMLANIADKHQHFCLLHSVGSNIFTGQYSFLGYDLKHKIENNNFDEQEFVIEDMYFGYFSYEMRHAIEKIYTQTNLSFINFPTSLFFSYKNILIFDHYNKTIEFFGEEILDLKDYSIQTVEVDYVKSNMSRAEYYDKLEQIKDHIRHGEVYQANLTRKYYGEFKSYDPISIYLKLINENPSPYSALIRFDDNYIISNSPEQFIKLEANGDCQTRPIKGTIKRDLENSALDEQIRQQLINCPKNRSENLMIVDLMRNDLNRSCLPGSVQVPELFSTISYRYIHHLYSSIIGKKLPEISPLQLLFNAFPPGSMTGAPKIRAVQICEELEKINRGVYSGILGWYKPMKNFEFSVVIRTLLIEKNKFEFQVGGAIVIDSDAEDEHQEIINKALPIAKSLNIINQILAL